MLSVLDIFNIQKNTEPIVDYLVLCALLFMNDPKYISSFKLGLTPSNTYLHIGRRCFGRTATCFL